jgi:hypothetical protein
MTSAPVPAGASFHLSPRSLRGPDVFPRAADSASWLKPATNSAAVLFKLADSIAAEQLSKDLSSGQLNSAIEALSNLELSETAVALSRIRKDLERDGNYESAAVADLVRDRVADEQKMRAAEN